MLQRCPPRTSPVPIWSTGLPPLGGTLHSGALLDPDGRASTCVEMMLTSVSTITSAIAAE
tara:strand:- start:807 stop:986 length:180 start_codon:yes stop_codon:yes gene_type:complete